MSVPRKHHFIPQFLVNEFTDQHGHVTVHSVRSGKQYRSNARNIGHQNDGHSLYRKGGVVDRTSLENFMNEIENEAALVIRALADGAELGRDHQWALAWFLALQWHRNRYLLDMLASELRPTNFTPQELQTILLDTIMVPFLSAWQLRNDTSVRYKDRWDSIVDTTMRSFYWSLCRYKDDSLVLSDQSICMWGVRDGGSPTVNAAWARHGIGIGWDDVKRVTIPLNPRFGLRLTRDPNPPRLTAPAFNKATIYNARRFVIHTPSWGVGRAALVQNFVDALATQRILATTFYRNQF